MMAGCPQGRYLNCERVLTKHEVGTKQLSCLKHSNPPDEAVKRQDVLAGSVGEGRMAKCNGSGNMESFSHKFLRKSSCGMEWWAPVGAYSS